MKVIHLITEVDEVSAAYRIHEAVKICGVESSFLALKKTGENDDITEIKIKQFEKFINKWIKILDDEILKHLYPNRKKIGFSSALSTGYKIQNYKEIREADVIHIHWINGGFLSLGGIRKLIKLNKPIICTLHDKWLLTGGCHVGCNQFSSGCGRCRVLKSNRRRDYSYFTIRQKKYFLKNNRFTLVAPSRWMLKNIKESFMFSSNECIRIPNTLRTEIFKKIGNENVERQLKYHKDKEKFHILVGADSIDVEYKGFRYFEEMLQLLAVQEPKLKDKIMIHLVGGGKLDNSRLCGYSVKKWGFVKKQEIMACLYNIADVYVHTSVADNFPGMILESMSCETPVVAFDVDGISDLITHKREGYLAEKGNVIELLKGIIWIYEQQKDVLGKREREKVELEYSFQNIGRQYCAVYQNVMERYSK